MSEIDKALKEFRVKFDNPEFDHRVTFEGHQLYDDFVTLTFNSIQDCIDWLKDYNE